MGATFINYQVKAGDAKRVADTLAGLVTGKALVSPAEGGWVSVYNEADKTPGAGRGTSILSRELSARLATAVLSFSVFDSDVVFYNLFEVGKAVDEFCSNPNILGASSNRAWQKTKGRPEVLAKLGPPGIQPVEFEAVLLRRDSGARSSRDSPAFAEERLARLASLLGMRQERAMMGYADVTRRPGQGGPDTRGFYLVQGDQVTEVRHEAPETLSEAASLGDLVEVRRFLAAGADPNGRDQPPYILGPIRQAATAGHVEVVRELLRFSTDAESRAEGLWCAASVGCADVVLALLEAGTPVDSRDFAHRTPLVYASSNDHPEVCKLLIEAGADVEALHEIHQTDLDTGIQVDFTGTCLMEASLFGYPRTAEVLIRGGANTNAIDEEGRTALWWAARKGHREVVEVLIDGGAEPTVAGPGQETPLTMATRLGHDDVVEILRRP